MTTRPEAQTRSPWEQFALKHNFGNKGKNWKESKQERYIRMAGANKTPRRKKKKKATLIRELFQSHFTEVGICQQDAEAFGDSMSKKPSHTFRCALQNIQMLPANARHYKSRQLVNHLREGEYDVVMLNEVGLLWSKVEAADQWDERVLMGGLHDSTAIFAYNTQEPHLSTTMQYGGVGLVAMMEAKHRVTDRGKDPSGMGRWAWLRMEGKAGHHMRFITAYRPCQSGGASSVFQQQARAMAAQQDFRNPRSALLDDVIEVMLEWKALGDHIVFGMDANEDIRQGEVHDRLSDAGFRELILDLHPDLSPPATQNRNTQREVIDGLYGTHGLSITKGGYLGFGEGCPSDHRLLWFEVSYSVAFGQRPSELALVRPKRLKSKDPRLAKRYCKQVNLKMRTSGFQSRFMDFKLRSSTVWSLGLQDEYNEIQKENTSIRKEVESKLRKLCMGGVPWSVEIQVLRDTIEVWAMLVRRKKRVQVSVKRIRRFLKRVPLIENAFSCSLIEATKCLTMAHQAYNAARKVDAPKWRESFQGTLAQAIADKKGTNVDTETQNLIRIERQRRMGRNVKRMRGRLGNNRVTKLWFTDGDGVRTQCTTQSSMERACFVENEARFSQTGHTPPMLHPTLDDLGFLGESESVEQILRGSYDPPIDTEIYMAELLQAMRMPSAIRRTLDADGPISSVISLTENSSGWKKRKLASAESSGLTMDHYAVGCEDSVLNEVDTLLRQLPYRHGFSPDSWCVLTDVEILKKPGVYDVELMRTIQLMHAEFNMNNKKLGRDIMAHAERHKALAPEQFGSRKNHQSILAALNKRLTMDLLRQRRQAGALCANDAKSCYDRIVHNVATLAMRRLGMPAEPILSMFDTLQRATHHVSTAFGISKTSYGGVRDVPLQGVGQGNGAGPAIWAVISTVLIAAMATQGHGFNLLSALSGTLVSFVCYAFVDDTDVIHSAESTATTGESVMNDMQGVLDRWGGLLRATGGALVPSKSYWYAIDFKWNGSRWMYRSCQDMPGEIYITGVDGRRVLLRRFEPHVGKETLGVMQAMDGNNVDEVRHLHDKAEQFADSMRTGILSKNDAWYALTATILKTMEYPMATTTMSEKQWNYVMAPILLANLPRAGLDRTFPRDVLFGPASMQGFGIMHPWYNQEITHLLECLKQTTIGGITGSLISATMEQLRLEVGLSGFLTDHVYNTYHDLVTPSWIATVWRFLSRFSIELRDTEKKLLLRRHNDQFLMEVFAQHGFSGQDLTHLNICRMYLHAVTLADLCNVDGRAITLNAWQGRRDPSSCAEYSWPRVQSSLPRPLWLLWQKALLKCFLIQGPSRFLSAPLGRWQHFPPRWRWFYSPSEDRLYKQERWLWRAYPVQRVRTSRRLGIAKYRQSDYLSSTPPPDLIPASVIEHHDSVIKVSTMEILDEPQADSMKPLNLEEFLSSRPKSFRWAVSQSTISDNGVEIAKALMKGTAVAVSDGSFKDSRGTAAFVIESESRVGRFVGVNIVPGEDESQSAYRSELTGIVGVLETLNGICVVHDITAGAIEIGLDGDQARKEAFGKWPLTPSRPDFDMLQHIRGLIEDSPLTITSRWIESHQDDNSPLTKLDRWGKLNVECDGLAKGFWNDCALAKTWTPNIAFGFEKWSMWIDGKKLSKIDKKKLYAYTFSARTRQYWHKKHSLTPALITSINWEACEEAMGRLPFGKKRWLLKHATGFCGVGRREFIRGNQDHQDCPRCGQTESSRHVVECRGTGADVTFSLAVKKLETHLVVLDTAPLIVKAIVKRLHQWRKFGDRALPRYQDFDRWGTQHAVRQQDAIGWYQFLLGRLALKWSDTQQRFIDSMHKKNTGRRWTTSVIQKALDVAWDMWQQRNDIKHNSLHPRRVSEVIAIKVQLQLLFRKGHDAFLAQDRLLFSKTESKLLNGTPEEMLQWIESVLNATRRAAAKKDDYERSMTAERDLMKHWLRHQRP